MFSHLGDSECRGGQKWDYAVVLIWIRFWTADPDPHQGEGEVDFLKLFIRLEVGGGGGSDSLF